MKRNFFAFSALACASFALFLTGCGGNTNNPYSPIVTGGGTTTGGGGGNPPDFTLTISPTTTQTVDEGLLFAKRRPGTQTTTGATWTITATAVNGFTGTIQLSASPMNGDTLSDLNTSFQPTSLSLTSSVHSQNDTFTAQVIDPAQPTGATPILITATSGSITHSVVAHLNVINSTQQVVARPN